VDGVGEDGHWPVLHARLVSSLGNERGGDGSPVDCWLLLHGLFAAGWSAKVAGSQAVTML